MSVLAPSLSAGHEEAALAIQEPYCTHMAEREGAQALQYVGSDSVDLRLDGLRQAESPATLKSLNFAQAIIFATHTPMESERVVSLPQRIGTVMACTATRRRQLRGTQSSVLTSTDWASSLWLEASWANAPRRAGPSSPSCMISLRTCKRAKIRRYRSGRTTQPQQESESKGKWDGSWIEVAWSARRCSVPLHRDSPPHYCSSIHQRIR